VPWVCTKLARVAGTRRDGLHKFFSVVAYVVSQPVVLHSGSSIWCKLFGWQLESTFGIFVILDEPIRSWRTVMHAIGSQRMWLALSGLL
jgi:hypothetical protein